MLTKSDRKTMAAMEAEFARDGHARSFIPAALADLDAKDVLLARVMEGAEWSVGVVYDLAGNLRPRRCPVCDGVSAGKYDSLHAFTGHRPGCIFAAIAKHLEGVRGGAGVKPTEAFEEAVSEPDDMVDLTCETCGTVMASVGQMPPPGRIEIACQACGRRHEFGE